MVIADACAMNTAAKERTVITFFMFGVRRRD